MRQTSTVLLGKLIRSLARLRGGGSALPGLIVEKINPKFVQNILTKLPMGVVLISGTNGKTTTTKIVVELLEEAGLKVFTNPTGSNFIRGVAAAIIAKVSLRGALGADIAVLELDEAHAVRFIQDVKPNYSLLLNVMRDQLDRFGEIDNTAKMLEKIAQATTDTVVFNREDPRIAKIAQSIKPGVGKVFFGLSDQLRATFPSDDHWHNQISHSVVSNTIPSTTPGSTPSVKALVTLKSIKNSNAVFSINNKEYTTSLLLKGIYNIYNGAAALALVSSIIPDKKTQELINTLSRVKPAFGRGETMTINNQPLELVLVKNPSGFRLALGSFDPKDTATLIAINDSFADGQDVSWLWDVDFSNLAGAIKPIFVSGTRAYDMALRLQYDEILTDAINPNIDESLSAFIASNVGRPLRIYCTYTAMLQIRRRLAKITKLERYL